MMSDPKFKVGDRVTWDDKPCAVTDGPFAGATFPEGVNSFYSDGFLYVVQPDCGRALLIHECRLRRAEEWVPCEGAHRHIMDHEPVYVNLERRKP